MKKIKVLIFFILIFFLGCKSKEEKMLEHLKKEYNEEFKLGFTAERRGAIITEIIPMRFVGTEKEYDDFYRSEVFINKRATIDDTYKDVLIKEDLEKTFKPKLEELFGKNILIALNLGGRSIYKTLNKEMDRRRERYKIHPNGDFFPLSGGIYIFGRVESEKDREKYRRGIYEFIQYLKQEGMFEYTNITISITDERLLSRAYNESIDKKEIDNIVNGTIRYKKIKETLKKYTKDFEKTPQEYKNNLLNNMIKSKMFEEISHKGIFLLHTRIRSYKYVKSRGLDTDERFNETARNFNKEDDIRFSIEDYKI